MSKFDLRDISERLTASRDTEAVVYEFLGYLQALHGDWRASLAFYEVSRDSLVNVYERHGNRLARRDLDLPVDQLPARLVRKFFHPSAFFTHADRRSMLTKLFQGSPAYEAEPLEAPALKTLTSVANWQSCICMPLADQEDMLAMLIIASGRKNAFGGRAVSEIIPVKSLTALALAQHLYRGQRPTESRSNGDEQTMRAAAAEFQERIRRLSTETEQLAEDNRAKAEKVAALTREIESLDKNSSAYKIELERVKGQLGALEEQSVAATEHLNEAYTQLTATHGRMVELERTVSFLKDVFQVLSLEHDPSTFTRTMVSWFCEHFDVDRCSLMVLDRSEEILKIAAQRGIAPEVVANVRVRVGQGISGWVAHNKKPLFIRVKNQADPVQHTGQDAYNSDSFICVPLIYNNHLSGVLNLSNKHDGEPFDELDLDRAMLAGSILAMAMGTEERSRRAAAWAA